MNEETITVTIAHYDPDILGIPGLYHEDGRVSLFCGSPRERLMLPQGAREIITDIYARAAARMQTDLWLKMVHDFEVNHVAHCTERPQRAWP